MDQVNVVRRSQPARLRPRSSDDALVPCAQLIPCPARSQHPLAVVVAIASGRVRSVHRACALRGRRRSRCLRADGPAGERDEHAVARRGRAEGRRQVGHSEVRGDGLDVDVAGELRAAERAGRPRVRRRARAAGRAACEGEDCGGAREHCRRSGEYEKSKTART